MNQKELEILAFDFRNGILGTTKSSTDMCFAICSPLVGYLNFLKYKCELTEGTVDHVQHFWITLPDGYIIDPTADQFDSNMPKIYIGKLPKLYSTSTIN